MRHFSHSCLFLSESKQHRWQMRNRLREFLIAASRQSRSEMRSSMKIGILAVQGAFAEHEQMLEQLGAEYIELRKGEDVRQSYDGLILPGGESTVQGKLMRELDMFDTIQSQIKNGMPVLATCAGAILLAQQLSNDAATHLATLPAVVRRNAYGRQLGSFSVDEQIEGIGTFPMRFIRAPYIEKVLDDTKVLAKVDGNIVMVENKNQLAMSFHPELTSDTRIHEMFLKKI
jgi:5'-phosphate synthase pdxT subunit